MAERYGPSLLLSNGESDPAGTLRTQDTVFRYIYAVLRQACNRVPPKPLRTIFSNTTSPTYPTRSRGTRSTGYPSHVGLRRSSDLHTLVNTTPRLGQQQPRLKRPKTTQRVDRSNPRNLATSSTPGRGTNQQPRVFRGSDLLETCYGCSNDHRRIPTPPSGPGWKTAQDTP